MNEPHTSDGFERGRGIAPGTIMAAWVQEMAAFFQGLDGAHLVSSGEEGYRVDGKPPVSDSDWAWMNSGLKGSDCVADFNDPNVDLATVRGYPGEFSCVLGRPVEAENVLETNQPTTEQTNQPLITDHSRMKLPNFR